MDTNKIAAVVLIVLGVLALVYGGFSYTRQTHEADMGPVHMSFDENRHVSIPVWAGVGAVVVGGLLFFIGARR